MNELHFYIQLQNFFKHIHTAHLFEMFRLSYLASCLPFLYFRFDRSEMKSNKLLENAKWAEVSITFVSSFYPKIQRERCQQFQHYVYK